MKDIKVNGSLALKTGLILLFTIFLSEMMIMTLFPKTMISSFLGAILDATILTFTVNFVVYLWVVIPISKVEKQNQLYRAQWEDAEHIAQFGSWEHDLQSDRMTCSKGACHILGLDPEQPDMSFNTFLSMVRIEDRPMLRNTLSIADKQNHYFEIEHKILRKDGVVRTFRERGKYYFDEDEFPVRIVGTILDVTEIRNQEQVLVELQTRVAKSSKIAALGEEMAYPLAIIREEAGLILSLVRDNQLTPEAGAANLENIFQMCERITKTINSFKNVS